MRALGLAFISALTGCLLTGCLDWQGSYSAAARKECREIINTEERLACLRRVAANETARRVERRYDEEADEPERAPREP